jgi:hypothetical protein
MTIRRIIQEFHADFRRLFGRRRKAGEARWRGATAIDPGGRGGARIDDGLAPGLAS